MSFDTLAPCYRCMEAFLAGGMMQRCRVAYLSEVAERRRALLMGEGPGRFLAALLQADRNVAVTCVERSLRMIDEAKAGISEADRSRVQFVPVDALKWEPPADEFDLIATNFFLDCFRPEQLTTLVSNISRSATRDACWLLTDFREPERGWRRWRGRVVLGLMYFFFRSVTGLSASKLTPPDRYLESSGFQLASRKLANFGLIHSDLWRRFGG